MDKRGGLYGYTMMYRETQNEKYLQQAINIAKFILHHPNLPEDKIPYWDFDAPNIPDEPRDASAGAIIASALLELGQYVNDDKLSKEYQSVAAQQLRTLSSDEYLAAPQTMVGLFLSIQWEINPETVKLMFHLRMPIIIM